jgi:hypothetical protein
MMRLEMQVLLLIKQKRQNIADLIWVEPKSHSTEIQ